ncbi:MAG: LamG domain-containing protein [bacterium]|nr:LamG domain-containing protein [bacterium]
MANNKIKNFEFLKKNVLLVFIFILFSVLYAPCSVPTAHAATIAKPINFLSINTGLVGWWTFDGKDTPWTSATAATTLDKSGNGNTGTLTNMAQATSPVAGKIGQGLKFDGTNDYVNAGTPASLSLTSQVTVGVWIKASSANPSGYGVAYVIKGTPGGSAPGYGIIQSGGSYATLQIQGTNLNSNFSGYDNKWHYVVGTYDGSNMRIYVDGVQKNSVGKTGAMDTTGYNFHIGTRSSVPTYFQGLLDDVRIYNRVLSATEITQLYNFGLSKYNVTPKYGVTSGLVGHWTFDGKDTPWTSATAATTLDKSGNGNTGTLTSMARATSPVAGKIGQGLKFDGNNNAIKVPRTSSINDMGTFSLAFWANIRPQSNVCGANDYFFSKANSGINGWELSKEVTCRLHFQADFDGATNLIKYSSTNSIVTNKWQFWVVTWDGSTSAANVHIYKNGIEDTGGTGNSDGAGARVTDSGRDLYISNWAGFTNSIDGLIDDVRIYNRVLSATEITQLYNIGAATKVAASPRATSGIGLNAGLVGYWTFDGKDTPWTSATAATTLDKSGNGNTGTLTSMARATSPVAGKIGQGLKFDGGDDCVNAGANSSLNITGAVTVSAWVRVVASAASKSIVSKSTVGGSSATQQYHLYNVGSNSIGFVVGNSTTSLISRTANNTVPNNIWSFVLGSYDGAGRTTFYFNGVQVDTDYDATVGVLNQSGKNLNIGGTHGSSSCNGGYFNGSIDDVRVYNRALSASEIQQLYNLGR